MHALNNLRAVEYMTHGTNYLSIYINSQELTNNTLSVGNSLWVVHVLGSDEWLSKQETKCDRPHECVINFLGTRYALLLDVCAPLVQSIVEKKRIGVGL